MAKPEWGTKRRCQSCNAAFYDMRKDPIVCPKCGTVFQPDALLKPRRRTEEKAAPKAPPKVVPLAADPDLPEDAAEEEFIEDASELGEDEDDVAEVIEGADEPEPER